MSKKEKVESTEAEVKEAAAPRPKLRVKRILYTLIFLGLIGAGLYAASWLNARRYFIIVNAGQVRIRKGRMAPVGHQRFDGLNDSLRRAYEDFSLPRGMKLPKGESVYDDRVELDQALYTILRDATEMSLANEDEQTMKLTQGYLARLGALPGINVRQQLEVKRFERDFMYVRARGMLKSGTRDLEQAAKLFRSSSEGTPGKHVDGETLASRIENALELLRGREVGGTRTSTTTR